MALRHRSAGAARRLLLVSAVPALCLAAVSPVRGQGSVAGDRAALVALYNSTDGGNWDVSTNWLSSKPLSEWYGVATGGSSRVTELHLWSNSLSGAIPPSLGDLTELRELNFLGNDLTGRIPPELGGLVHLWRIDLFANRLTGGIPAALGSLPNLEILSLRLNALTGEIPATLGNPAGLRLISLSQNDLSGTIPEELGGLERLRVLQVGANSLSGTIPATLGELEFLDSLELSFNRGLSGALPSGFADLDRLREVDIHGTGVCVPAGERFRDWASRIRLDSSGLVCGTEPSTVPVIDMAVFYTPAARAAAGGSSGIEATIDLMVTQANQAYADSGVRQRIALVVREEAAYVESGSTLRDVLRLEDPSDGYLDGVHPIRDIVGADLVHLIVGRATACGVGLIASRADTAVGATHVHCDGLTLAHELGHNMGLSHDRYALCGPEYCDLPEHYAYGFGYVNQQAFEAGAPPSARWRTIMAYEAQCTSMGIACELLGLFSDPGNTRGGDALGRSGERDVPGLRGPSNAVRALNEVRHSVASFRQVSPRSAGQSPVAVGSLADRMLQAGGASEVVDVSRAFRDPNGDVLTYGGMSSIEKVADVRVQGSYATIRPRSPGRTTITVTVTDGDGSNTSAWQQFAVIVDAVNAVDYDADDDGLIEIRTLAQLDAVRYDANGAGDPSSVGKAAYDAAFPNRGVTMGCGGGMCRGYELLADLDFDTNRSGGPDAGDTYWNNGAGWEPIGPSFSGALATTFKGNGRTISNLFVNRQGDAGLLGNVAPLAVIRYLRMDNVNVTGTTAGGLVGFNASGVVSGVRVTGRVAGTETAGGLVGHNTGRIVGGAAQGQVSANEYAGGLVGWNAGSIGGSYAASRVEGEPAGGLVGTNVGLVTASYARGHIEAADRGGGLAGSNTEGARIVGSYAAAVVVGDSGFVGGLTSTSYGDVTASYWDTEESGQTSSGGGSGQTTAALQAATGYTGLYATWNRDLDGDGRADDPWDFGTATQYPVLKADINGDGRATWQEFGDQGRGDTGGGDGADGPGPGATITVNAECAEGLCRARTGVPVSFEGSSAGAVRSWSWDFGDGRTSQGRSAEHAWSEPGFFEVTLTVSDGESHSTALRTFLVEASYPAGTCAADAETRCLQDSRYQMKVDWWGADGESGPGSVVHVGTNDSGLFTFFNRENWEILIKVLDGCAVNGHVWVYGASTTDLGYSIRVIDTVTGVEKEYRNEPGRPAPAITDGTAFPEGCM